MSLKQLIKERLLYPLVLCRSRTAHSQVCLTFDDGPHPECTPRILDILDRERVKATFFCVGRQMLQYPQILERARAAGHEVANHSMTHTEFAQLSIAGVRQEIAQVDTIRGADGASLVTTSYFRPPKGVLNRKVLAHCLQSGRRIVLWSNDPEDFRAQGAPEILRHFDQNPIEAGDVVLLHDRIEATVTALPDVLRRINFAGLKAVTVSELFGARPLAELQHNFSRDGK